MSSIKERIAALNAKSSSSSNPSSPPPPQKNVSKEDNQGSENENAEKRKSLTIAERIALMKAKNEGQLNSVNSSSSSIKEREKTSSISPTPITNDGAVEKRGSLTIAERIALMNANSAESSSTSPPRTTKRENSISPSTSPPRVVKRDKSVSPSVSPSRILTKGASAPTLNSPPRSVKKGGEKLYVSDNSTQEVSTSSCTKDKAQQEESMTIAERIALMKAKSASSAGMTGTAGKSSNINSKNIKECEKNSVSEDPVLPKSQLDDGSNESIPLETSQSPKRLSVADKIAALKAKSEAESKTTHVASLDENESRKRRSVSVAEKIALMKQKSMEETQAMMSPSRPKSHTFSTSDDTENDDNEDICDRSSVGGGRPSFSRRLDPKLMARASIAMPMIPGMAHPGLGHKSASTGSLLGGQRPLSSGSIRVVNESSESGEITHTTMSRARTKKKRKSSVNSLSLLISDMDVKEPLPSIERVSTVMEGDERMTEEEELHTSHRCNSIVQEMSNPIRK